MSTEPTPAPETPTQKPLREPIEIQSGFTFDGPNILLNAVSAGGFVTHSVREGSAIQIAMTTRIEWSENPVDEHDQVFGVRALNQIKFASQRISVINDATEIGDIRLPATSPSASEYQAKIGQRVMIHFDCHRDIIESQRLGRPVYKIVRNSIILP